MMDYPTVTALAKENHYSRGRLHRIDTVIVHATAGRNSLDWLRSTSNPPVSVHVLVAKDGTRYRIVRDEDTAWHAGYGLLQLAGGPRVNLNSRSLGLELENLNNGTDPYPTAQVDAAAEQLAQWLTAYPWLSVFRHSDVDDRKHDPAGLDMAALHRRVHWYLCRLFGK